MREWGSEGVREWDWEVIMRADPVCELHAVPSVLGTCHTPADRTACGGGGEGWTWEEGGGRGRRRGGGR